MMVGVGERTGRHFLRVSKDRSGRERSNEEQVADNERRWDELRFVGEPYREVASASRFAKRQRDEFPRLLADLEAGRFGADVLVMWEGSRGSRRVSEWVTLIEACEDAAVHIAITEDERIYNPANARDRKELIDLANDAEYESARSSGRIKRAAAETAKDGRSIGPVIYGYRRIYDPTTREFVRQEPDPDEAPIVREVFERAEAGHPFRAIARDLNTRGITTRRGKPWSGSELRRMVINIAYIGKRSHVSLTEWRTLPAAERRARANRQAVDAWEPIVTERQWHTVQRTVTDPTRTMRPRHAGQRWGAAVHPFTTTIRCDTCNGPLHVVTYRSPDGHYYCQHKGCCMIVKPALDDYILDALMGYLERDDIAARVTAVDVTDEAIDAALGDIAKIKAELDELYDAVGSGQATAMMQARAEPAILARLETAEQRYAELTTPPELLSLIKPGPGVRHRWAGLPVAAQRRIARLLLSPAYLGELRVTPAPRRLAPVEERVRWRID